MHHFMVVDLNYCVLFCLSAHVCVCFAWTQTCVDLICVNCFVIDSNGFISFRTHVFWLSFGCCLPALNICLHAHGFIFFRFYIWFAYFSRLLRFSRLISLFSLFTVIFVLVRFLLHFILSFCVTLIASVSRLTHL